MPQPPKRRGERRGGPRPDAAPYKVPNAPTAGDKPLPRAATEQQIASTERPSAGIAQFDGSPLDKQNLMPFAKLDGVLDNGLLDGVKAMGFE